MELSLHDSNWYKLQASILPQPLAFIMGRIARTDRLSEQVDCIRRAAEVLTRYIAIIQASSIAYSDNQKLASELIIHLPENFSWGTYVTVIRSISKIDCDHPLKKFLANGIVSNNPKNLKNRVNVRPKLSALEQLEKLIELRNSMTDHSLVGIDDHKAVQLLEEYHIEDLLRGAVEGFKAILSLPLIVISGRKYIRREKAERYRILHYKGENDPYPINVLGTSGLIEEKIPYIVLGHRLISLSPGMVVDSWAPHRTGLYFIDGVKNGKAKYRTIFSDDLRYRDESEGWPLLEWREPEDHEEIYTPPGKNLRMLLDESVISLHSEAIASLG